MSPGARIAAVVPAAGCPCAQAQRVLQQLGSHDHLVVVLNGPPRHHDCAAALPNEPRCTVVERPWALTPAAARNLGVKAVTSGAKVYAFADCDDRVALDWLRELTSPLLAGTADLTGGALDVVTARRRTTVLPGKDYWHEQALFGGNLATTAAAWHTLDGFDPTMRHCEDTDLAWRAAKAGLSVEVVPAARVEVEPRRPLPEVAQRFQWGHSAALLLARHGLGHDHLPTLRQLLDHKRSTRYCRTPLIAAVGQWTGQQIGRIQQPSDPPTIDRRTTAE